MRIGIFGGSFDPVHVGHLAVAEAAAEQLGLDRIHLVPAKTQPFKAGLYGAPPEDRLAMLRLALRGHPRLVADDREMGREGVSYTVDTLSSFAEECPEDELFLLIGADAARDLAAWRDADSLPGLAEIVVLTRPGAAVPEDDRFGHVLRVPAVDVSATEIRSRVRRGEGIRDRVPPEVADYIESQRLYRAGDRC